MIRFIRVECILTKGYKLELNQKNREITEKEKALNIITATNNKLMATLDLLKKEVDEKFEKISTTKQLQLSEKMRNNNNPNNPIHIF